MLVKKCTYLLMVRNIYGTMTLWFKIIRGGFSLHFLCGGVWLNNIVPYLIYSSLNLLMETVAF